MRGTKDRTRDGGRFAGNVTVCGEGPHVSHPVLAFTRALVRKLFSDNYSLRGIVKHLTSFFSLCVFDVHPHSEALSLASLFQSTPFLSGFSTTPSSCPDPSSRPRRTSASSWPPWGGSSITSRKAAGSRPGGCGFSSPPGGHGVVTASRPPRCRAEPWEPGAWLGAPPSLGLPQAAPCAVCDLPPALWSGPCL